MSKKYNLKKDHADIKQQIKEWEISTDFVINCLRSLDKTQVVGKDGNNNDLTVNDIIDELEDTSHEMCAINL